MRNLQLSFNQTQNVRLEKALEKLESLSSNSNPNSSVTVGDTIPVYEDGVLKASLLLRLLWCCRTHQQVDLRTRFTLQIQAGDGRYCHRTCHSGCSKEMEIGSKLHPRCYFDAFFNELSDGFKKRRTAVDELNMRSVFTENDLVCAEVGSS